MGAVLGAAVPVFGLIFAGACAGRLGVLDAAVLAGLNRFVVMLALPALLFDVTVHTPAGRILDGGFLGAFGGGIAVTFGAALWLARRSGLAAASVQGLNASFANAGFMGIPLCQILFGPASLPIVAVAVVLTASLLFALALALIEADLAVGSHVLRSVLGRLARNPLLVAPAAGFAWSAIGWPLPDAVAVFAKLLAGAASPCALVSLGLFVAAQRAGLRSLKVGWLVLFKLLLQPAVTWALAELLGLPPLTAETAVLLSALPTGTGPFVLAQAYGCERESASAAILVSTVLSVITVSLLVARFAARFAG